MSKIVRSVDRFDAKGRPLSSYEAMEKRIKLLEQQRDRLLRALKSQAPLKVVEPVEQQTLH